MADMADMDDDRPQADPVRGNHGDDGPDRRGPSFGQESDETEETTVPPIPDDPVTDTYPLLAHLEDEDDSQRLQAFTQVLSEMRGELDRLTDPDRSGQGSSAGSGHGAAGHDPSRTGDR